MPKKITVTEAEAQAIIVEAGLAGTITAAELAAELNKQLEGVAAMLRNEFINGLGPNPVPEAIARATALADVQAKGFLLDMTKTDLNRIGKQIAGGLKEGLGPDAIERRIRDSIGLDVSRAAKVDKLRDALEAQGLSKEAIDAQVDKLSERLRKERAEAIARTETRRAVSGADLTNAITDGDKFKAWMTVGDERVSDECQANEAEGWIPIDQEFSGGVDNPPQHPNCLIPETPVFAPDYRAAFIATYNGPIVDVITADTGRISVTPNHMLLTPRGWICAKSIREGDEILYCPALNPATPDSPYGHDVPASIKQMVSSFPVSNRVCAYSVPLSAEHLHGDAEFVESDIDVVWPNGFLRSDLKPEAAQSLSEVNFCGAYVRHFGLFPLRSLAEMLIGLRNTSDGIMGGRRESKAFSGRHSRHAQLVGLGAGTWNDSGLQQGEPNGRPTHSGKVGYCEFGEAGFIEATRVIFVGTRPFHGHVYDLQTSTSLYIASGLISSNCRCSVVTRAAEPSEQAKQRAEDRAERTEAAKAEAAAMAEA